jgi:transcriptional regulator with XRE-family HTH domain
MVGRVEEGPWRDTRRAGRCLVLLRAQVPSAALPLDFEAISKEREEQFVDWLRFSSDYYDPGYTYAAETKDESILRTVDLGQRLGDTLTRHEVEQAKRVGQDLVGWARNLGVTGGLRIHQIGPHGRQFCHELSVVGEIRFRNDAHRREFEASTGVGQGGPGRATVFHEPIECVLLPPGYRHAARVLLAGTAWRFNLDAIGAQMNEPARANTHYVRARGFETGEVPAGLRGALAWPPLFLLSAAAFFSRNLTLYEGTCRHNRCAAFGTWRKELAPNADYRSEPQKRRAMRRGQPIKEGWARDPIRRLESRRRELGVSLAAIARVAGCKPQTLSKLFRQRQGSQALIARVGEALKKIASEQERALKLWTREDVKAWMKNIGLTQTELAQQIGVSPGKVGRQLRGVSAWSTEFAAKVALAARQSSTGASRSEVL